ncbi:hypothetical protein QCM80_43940 [Bradyrhizobium sp. SSUT112]|uniref:hypothetical protein n=1 Tax=Bradyrhizobium sp. SSUT112 TaxID=3040604 RepID=UPI00244A8F83|nr:hypothetical protein [Bradyrhizobium sp. SSUT112]MDH2357455.1 hypothetical protein [Bradyrhizobium sp. SSUT112]
MPNTTTTTASSFLSSLGINTNAGAYADAYTNSSLIISGLNYLGISHVRDSYTTSGSANAVIDALANAGISFDFRVGNSQTGTDSSGLAKYVTSLAEFASEHPGSLSSIEGINEADLNSFSYNGLASLAGASAFQEVLYTAVKTNGVLNNVTVVNFSIGHDTDATHASAGDMSAYSDAANAHIYVQTGALADMQIERGLARANDISSHSVIVTETGYTTLASTVGVGVNEDAQAKLLLSNLLLAYEDGSSATYLYQLFDTPSSAPRGAKEISFGLFSADGTPKEAAIALHNLTTILNYGDDGGTYTGVEMNYTLSNAPSNTHTMLMNKSGGVSDLVVWADGLVWNSATQTEINTPETSVTVNLGRMESAIYVYDPLKGTAPIAVYYNTDTIQIGLSDHPLVVEVGATSAVSEDATTVDHNLTMTSADFVAQMETLVSATGLGKVNLSDSQVLAVSSPETMQYAIVHYGDLLSKISGDYSFSITRSGDGWIEEKDFDARGSLTVTFVWGVSGNGDITSKSIIQADGRHESYHYGIIGQSYESDHTAYDASGKVTLIERFHADGSYQYKAIYNTDGSKVYNYYTSTGTHSSDVVVTSTSTTTTTFDTTTGYKLSVYTANADGSADNKTYTNGILTKDNVLHKDGSSEVYGYNITGQPYTSTHQVADTSGKVTLIERFHADGSYQYEAIYYADGSKVYNYYTSAGTHSSDVVVTSTSTTTTTFDTTTGYKLSVYTANADGSAENKTYANGVLIKDNILHKDGSSEVYGYTINGQPYTSTHQVADASGKVTLIERFNADGSSELVTYTNGAIASKAVKYAAGAPDASDTKIYTAGVLTTETIVHADKSKDIYLSNLTGRTYVAEHDVYNAAGALTSSLRTHADGSTDYIFALAQDGTKTTNQYDANSVLKTHFVVNANGSSELVTYSNGVIASDAVKYAAGAPDTFDTKIYAAGVLAVETTVHADKSKDIYVSNLTGRTYVAEHDVYNTAGVLTSSLRTHADGSTDYTFALAQDGTKTTNQYDANSVLKTHSVVNANGSSELVTYTNGVIASDAVKYAAGAPDTFDTKIYAAGVLAAETIVHADKSKDIYLSNLTGRTYVAEHDVYNTASVLTSSLRTHADGSTDYTFALAQDGTKTTNQYDANSVLKTHSVVNANGSSELVTYTNGVIASDAVKYAAGAPDASDTKIYTAGVLTTETIVHADKSKDIYLSNLTGRTYVAEHDVYNTAGVLTSSLRTHADGSTDYIFALAQDGTKTTNQYDANSVLKTHFVVNANGSSELVTYSNGVIASDAVKYAAGAPDTFDTKIYAAGVLAVETIVHADKSKDIYVSNLTGRTYVAEHDSYNAPGILVSVDRAQNDGTHQQTAFASRATLVSTNGVSDLMRGSSAGGDTFVFNTGGGSDTISLFHAGDAYNHDIIQVADQGSVLDFASWASAHLQQAPGSHDTVVSLTPTDHITLKGVAMASLTASDFHFV